MSACEKFDKDRVVFITKEDYDVAPKLELKVIPDESQTHGLILPNGEINFSCPCLGNMASGPCAYEFREAFSCFHNSQNEFKGSDCIDKFVAMQNCVTKYPNLYQHENAAFNQEPNMEKLTATRALDSKEDKTV